MIDKMSLRLKMASSKTKLNELETIHPKTCDKVFEPYSPSLEMNESFAYSKKGFIPDVDESKKELIRSKNEIQIRNEFVKAVSKNDMPLMKFILVDKVIASRLGTLEIRKLADKALKVASSKPFRNVLSYLFFNPEFKYRPSQSILSVALDDACKRGNVDVVDFLLNHPLLHNHAQASKFDYSCFTSAAKRGQIETMKLLMNPLKCASVPSAQNILETICSLESVNDEKEKASLMFLSQFITEKMAAGPIRDIMLKSWRGEFISALIDNPIVAKHAPIGSANFVASVVNSDISLFKQICSANIEHYDKISFIQDAIANANGEIKIEMAVCATHEFGWRLPCQFLDVNPEVKTAVESILLCDELQKRLDQSSNKRQNVKI